MCLDAGAPVLNETSSTTPLKLFHTTNPRLLRCEAYSYHQITLNIKQTLFKEFDLDKGGTRANQTGPIWEVPDRVPAGSSTNLKSKENTKMLLLEAHHFFCMMCPQESSDKFIF